jgi:3-deoxy-D-manno-octulosonic-acid transferase
VSKDTRFDRVYHTTLQARELPLISAFKGNAALLVAGSSYAYEENLIKEYLDQASSTSKVIVAPHEIDAAHIQAIQHLFVNQKTLLYSEATEQNCVDAQVLIINNIGLLASIYRYADIALIGGGFGKKGLHNTLEAATFGMPVLFGPNNHDKFPEAQQLIDAGAAHVINTNEEFTALVNSYLQHKEKRKETGANARNFILENLGSTDIILNHIQI